MRLVSCIGLLMVIPAIALLTHSNGHEVNKMETVETRKQDKTISITKQGVEQPDSVQLSKVNKIPVQNHPDLTANSAVKPTPIPTEQ